MRALLGTLASAAVLATIVPPAHAQDRPVDIGVRLEITAAHGVPANDIPGAAVVVHYALNDQWTIAGAIARTEYDFEEPAKIVGIAQDPNIDVVDALAEGTTLSLWVETATADASRPMRLFVGAGLGAAFTDVPEVSAARADGGRFDIHTEVDTEIVVFAIGGLRRRFGERWYGEAAVRLEQHFADWHVTDRISGASGSIDDYLTWGVHIGAGWRW